MKKISYFVKYARQELIKEGKYKILEFNNHKIKIFDEGDELLKIFDIEEKLNEQYQRNYKD